MIDFPTARRLLLVLPLCLLANPLQTVSPAAAGRDLPATGPIPAKRIEQPRVKQPLREMSVNIPIPSPRPDGERESEKVRPGKSAKPGDLPEAEAACRKALSKFGIAFVDEAPITEADGCRIAHPLIVKSVSSEIALKPDAKLNCATALSLARFFSRSVPPLAKKHLAQPIRSVRHASAYVCRPRRGTQTLSEHAYGNALDIAAFVLADGTQLAVAAQDDPKSGNAAFLDAFRAAACGPFKTVLGPGTDADHADHFHLDMKKRRNDYTYCK